MVYRDVETCMWKQDWDLFGGKARRDWNRVWWSGEVPWWVTLMYYNEENITIPQWRKWQPAPVFLQKMPWTEEPGGLQSMGLQKSFSRLSVHVSTHTLTRIELWVWSWGKSGSLPCSFAAYFYSSWIRARNRIAWVLVLFLYESVLLEYGLVAPG